MDAAFFVRVVDFEGQEFALGEDGVAAGIHDVPLQAAHHDLAELGGAGLDGAGEALVVQKLEERSEGFLVAVVGGGREEEVVGEVGGDALDGLGAEARLRVLAAARRGDVVGFVDDEDAEFAGIGHFRRQGLLQEAEAFALLDPVHGGDEEGKGRPGIGLDAALPAEVADEVAVDDAEREAELVVHLALPVREVRGRRHDQDGAGAVAEQQFLDDQARLDGLAEAGVVRNQQVDACHVDGADERVELVVFDGDAAPEGRQEVGAVDVRGDAPADGVQEGVELVVEVVAFDRREAGLFEDARAGFDLPDHRKTFAAGVFLDGFERHEVLFAVGVASGMVGLDRGNKPLAAADFHQFARLGNPHGVEGGGTAREHPGPPPASPPVSNAP